MPASVSVPFLSVAASATVAVAAVMGMRLARGSTAVPAAAWGVAAAAAFAVEAWGRAAGGLEDPAAAASARLAVVAVSLCPIMALLGAKRPQHGVWQFIVATLAVVLAMPAASATLVRPGSFPDVHPLQRWLVLAVVLVTGMNYLATRHAVAAGLVVAGQLLLARSVLPFAGPRSSAWIDAGGIDGAWIDAGGAWLVAAGAVIAAVQSVAWPLRRGPRSPGYRDAGAAADPAATIDAGFLPLRETIGAAWTLRIMERFNAEASARGWPCRLRFDGFEAADAGDRDRGWEGEATGMMRALLRRFATPEWLARHAADPENP